MFGDIGKMLKLVGELKTKLPEMKSRLEEAEFSADAGGGAVTATVKGNMRLSGLLIHNKELLNEAEQETLAELIMAAVNAAQGKAAEASAKAMSELTGGVKIPGMESLLG